MTWEAIEAVFPREAAMRGDVVDHVRTHPGCTFEELRESLRPRYDAGLMVVLHELSGEGTIVMVPGIPVARHYLPGEVPE